MLTTADKTWLRNTIRREIKALLEDMVEGQAEAVGGYDGATPVVEDEWADESRKRRRVGFTLSPGNTPNAEK